MANPGTFHFMLYCLASVCDDVVVSMWVFGQTVRFVANKLQSGRVTTSLLFAQCPKPKSIIRGGRTNAQFDRICGRTEPLSLSDCFGPAGEVQPCEDNFRITGDAVAIVLLLLRRRGAGYYYFVLSVCVCLPLFGPKKVHKYIGDKLCNLLLF